MDGSSSFQWAESFDGSVSATKLDTTARAHLSVSDGLSVPPERSCHSSLTLSSSRILGSVSRLQCSRRRPVTLQGR